MDSKSFAEMAVHVPMCTHKEPSCVLVLGATQEIKNEFEKYSAKIEFVDTLGDVLSKNEKIFDIVIFVGEKPDEVVLANLEKIIKNDGIFAFLSSHYNSNFDDLCKDLKIVGKNFWIAMPYTFDKYCMILASKIYHPTADIILQRSDLLDDLDYYSTEIHGASFVAPASIFKKLTNIAKR
jgi:spermidine synthase